MPARHEKSPARPHLCALRPPDGQAARRSRREKGGQDAARKRQPSPPPASPQREAALRRTGLYSAESTRILAARYADGLRTMRRGIGQRRARPCQEKKVAEKFKTKSHIYNVKTRRTPPQRQQTASSHAPRTKKTPCHNTAYMRNLHIIAEKSSKKTSSKVCRIKKSAYLCNRKQETTLPVLTAAEVSEAKKRALSSAGSERLPYKQRVGGSNPSAPTPLKAP